MSFKCIKTGIRNTRSGFTYYTFNARLNMRGVVEWRDGKKCPWVVSNRHYNYLEAASPELQRDYANSLVVNDGAWVNRVPIDNFRDVTVV